MALPPFVSDAVVLEDVAAALKLKGGAPALLAKAGSWAQVVNRVHGDATAEIYAALSSLGYSPAQIAGWDRGPSWERNLSLLWALEQGGALEQVDDKLLQTLREAYESDRDKRTGLYEAIVTVAGAAQDPRTAFGQAVAGQPRFVEGADVFDADPRKIRL